MPRKAKKLSPEELEEAFREFQNSEEYLTLQKASRILKDCPNIDTGTKDMTDEKFHELIEVYGEVIKRFKAKPKKEIKYEYFRGFIMGSRNVGIDEQQFDQGTPIEYDSRVLLLPKPDADQALKARSAFLDVYNQIDMLGMIEDKNFQEKRKEILTKCKDFVKHYDSYVKKHHKAVHDILMDFHGKLRNALQANFRYTIYDYKNDTEDKRKITDWKEESLLAKLCDELQLVWDILKQQEDIKDNPSLHVLTAKLKIPNWRKNKIQSYYLQPLYDNWNNLRKEMARLFSYGENHWDPSMGGNKEFLSLTQKLIATELVAERMLGDAVKRDQLDFMFNTILYIFNSPARDDLLNGTPLTREYIIPRLLVLRYLDHVVKMTQVKRYELEKAQRKQDFIDNLRKDDPLVKYTQKRVNEEKKEDAVKKPVVNKTAGSTGFNYSPQPSPGKNGPEEEKYEEEGPVVRDTKKPQISAMPDEDSLEDLETYGRYWIWREYMPLNSDQEILEAAEELRKVNIAVRQDLADFYISAVSKSKGVQKKKHGEIKKPQNEPNPQDESIRPPNQWNHPDIVEKEHKFRGHTHPEKLYIDKRIQGVDDKITGLCDKILKDGFPLYWNELVDNVIKFFIDFKNEEHDFMPLKLDQYQYVYP